MTNWFEPPTVPMQPLWSEPEPVVSPARTSNGRRFVALGVVAVVVVAIAFFATGRDDASSSGRGLMRAITHEPRAVWTAKVPGGSVLGDGFYFPKALSSNRVFVVSSEDDGAGPMTVSALDRSNERCHVVEQAFRPH